MQIPGLSFVRLGQLIGEAAGANEMGPRFRFDALFARNPLHHRSNVNGQIALNSSEHQILGASVLRKVRPHIAGGLRDQSARTGQF
jgi:hypothetical protein